MERKLHLLCTIMSLLMVTSCVTGQGLTKCTWDSKSCSCETNKGTISLAPLSKSTPYKIEDTANNQNFYWSPCKDFKMAEAGITAGAIQQLSPSTFYEIGSHSNANSDTTSDGYARFYMSASDHLRATYVQCQCASGFDLKFIEEKPQTEFQFVLKAEHCCPGYVPPTAGYVELDVNPSEVLEGLTQTLTVNCSFTYSGASHISNLTSLVLTKTNSSDSEHHIMRLASIDVATPNQISTPFLDNDTLSGQIDANNQSYLAIEWSYPTEEQTGKYFCEAHGVDDDGYTFGITKIVEVTLTDTNGLHELIERFSELQRQLDRQEDIAKSQTETIDYLASLIKNQSETITSQQSQLEVLLNQTKAQTNTIGELRTEFSSFKNLVRDFEISGERYYGQYYILSKEGWNNSTEAYRICETDGGSLAQIGSSDEFQFIKEFLDGYSGFTEVLVSGTDEEHDGNWTYSNRDVELEFTDWGAGEPRQSQDNCLVLHRSYLWQMFTFPCAHSHVDIKFLCEVNNMN